MARPSCSKALMPRSSGRELLPLCSMRSRYTRLTKVTMLKAQMPILKMTLFLGSVLTRNSCSRAGSEKRKVIGLMVWLTAEDATSSSLADTAPPAADASASVTEDCWCGIDEAGGGDGDDDGTGPSEDGPEPETETRRGLGWFEREIDSRRPWRSC